MPALIGLILDVTSLTPSELRWELAAVAIGFILLSVGFAATAVFLFRRSSDLTLVYFGSASILYALRMLFGARMIRLVFSIENSVWNHFDSTDRLLHCRTVHALSDSNRGTPMEKHDPLAGCGTTCFRVRPPGVHTIENRRKGRKSRQQRIHHFLLSAYIFVDMDKLVLRYAGAGHPPLLIAPRNAHIQKSESREIEENGSMLGLFPEAT